MGIRVTVALGLMSVGMLWGGLALSKEVPDGSTISVERAVHFLSPDGVDTVLAPGIYGTEAKEEKSITVTPLDGGNAITIQAESGTHRGATLRADGVHRLARSGSLSRRVTDAGRKDFGGLRHVQRREDESSELDATVAAINAAATLPGIDMPGADRPRHPSRQRDHGADLDGGSQPAQCAK